ncbi:uncharacterized protein LOC133171643 [Saccostrea echinata]|uniref:uncharacterized protein LOC133171643 n=1 Tax=Saccostrea echinata TaxID=191078 RepID=UPI002A7EBB99|nr:uncharacterized protein LOC133171643 [Saccostrea echinata]
MKQRKKQAAGRSKDQRGNHNGIIGPPESELGYRKSGKNRESSITKKPSLESDLFPRYSEWIVFLITLILRIFYVCQKHNWWILHPDEIFQSMEVAFSEVHGYGFRPYEFLPPATGPNVTSARSQERMLGMYALRSFIYPRILASVGSIVRVLGYRGSLYLIWKIFHAGVTSCLPLATYFFCKKVTGSRDVSVISCILVASSAHLWVFGTHTFLNSFLSPFVFIVLGHFISFITILSDKEIYKKEEKNCVDEFENNNNNVHVMHNCNGVHHCQSNVDKLHVKSQALNTAVRKECNLYNIFLMGYFTGLFIYLRPDLLTLYFSILLPYMPLLFSRLKHIISNLEIHLCIVSGFVGILTGVLEDFLSYGTFVVTPVQWVSFNVLNGYARRIFGAMPTLFYFEIFCENTTLIFLSLCIIFVLISTISKPITVLVFFRKCLFALTCLIVLYSLQGHKEARFLHDAIVLFYVCSGASLFIFVQEVSIRIKLFNNNRYTERLFHSLLLLCFISSQYQSIPSSQDNSIKKWTYEGKTDSHDVNVCLDFIGQKDDVKGVFIDRDMHMTGGYTILNRDIPWFSLINTEFREFSKDSRLTMKSFYGITKVSLTSNVSNYIHIQNTPFLLKCILRQKEYNYLVMKITREFINQGYEEVFRYGTMRVLKRTFDRKQEEYLTTLGNSISDNKNSTILKYEGQWLMAYGSYDLAREKFNRAAEINSDTQVYQFLIELYRRMGEPENARKIFRICRQAYNESECLKSARKIALFEHERISLK